MNNAPIPDPVPSTRVTIYRPARRIGFVRKTIRALLKYFLTDDYEAVQWSPESAIKHCYGCDATIARNAVVCMACGRYQTMTKDTEAVKVQEVKVTPVRLTTQHPTIDLTQALKAAHVDGERLVHTYNRIKQTGELQDRQRGAWH